MQSISILSFHLGLQGSYANILDLNHYLHKDYEVNFYTTDIKDLYNVTRGSKRLHTFNELRNINHYKTIEEDIVITDFKSLIKLFENNIKVVCKKFIVMDNNELSYHLNKVKHAKFFHHNLDINRLIKPHQYKDILFLFPPSNVEQFTKQYPDIPFRVFFKKIH